MNLSTTTESLLGIFGEKKGKLVWNGSLKDLKTFISTIIEEKAAESAIWRSPSGGKWCFISDVLGVTWYAKSKTICFDGPKADDLVARIQVSETAFVYYSYYLSIINIRYNELPL